MPSHLVTQHYAVHTRRIEALFAGRKLEPPVFLCGISRWIGHEEHLIDASGIPDLVYSAVDALCSQRDRVTRDHVFRPLVVEHWGYGTHFVDAVFGAAVSVQADGNSWSKELSSDVGTLCVPDITQSPEVQRMAAVTDALVQAVAPAGDIFLTLPVLSCPLNIAVNLYGERFLLALLEAPALAERDLQVIADTIIALHRLFRARIPASMARVSVAACRFMPEGYGLIDGCTTQLVSPSVYRNLIAPQDNRILADYPHGGMMHLCGASEHHIPALRAMPALRAVQLNDRATEAFEAYYTGLRDDQLIYVCPTPSMPVERILQISNGGHRVVLAVNDA